MNKTKTDVKMRTINKPCMIQISLPGSYSISIIGSGMVGENVGKGLIEIGQNVIFFDVDNEKVRKLKASGYNAVEKLKTAVLASSISYFCVPTPATEKGKIDLSYIKEVAKKTGRILRKKQDYHLIVVKSTVLPMTTENVIIPLLEKHSGKKVGKDFGVCCNPEFLTEIHNSWTKDKSFVRGFFNEPFIVIGGFDKQSGDILAEVYGSLEPPIVRIDLRTAEMLKYAFNCALATRISYWNEIFLVCRKLGIDSNEVASIASKDPRIGKYGMVHKMAFGGKCLPKDLSALVTFCKQIRHNPKLLEAVLDINWEIANEFGIRE
jgi:UDPglucose 6-dehydrogenase